MGMTDFPQITEPVKPLYATTSSASLGSKKDIEKRKNKKIKLIKQRKFPSNTVLPFDGGVILPKIQEHCTHNILIRTGFKWCSYLQRPIKMDDGFEEVRFQEDNNAASQNTKSNYHNNLEVNMKAGDSSNNVGTYLEQNNQHKNHDYIDDVLSFQPHYNQNKQGNIQPMQHLHHQLQNTTNNTLLSTTSTKFITSASICATSSNNTASTTTNNNTSTATTTTICTTTVTNNSNPIISSSTTSPLKPPRHVKLKKTTQLKNNNFNNNYHNNIQQLTNNNNDTTMNAITTADVIHKSVYLDPSNNLEQPPHTAERNYRNKYISIGIQASPLPPYRLRVLPKCPQPPPAKKLDEASLGDEVLTSSGCLLCIGFQTCGHCLGRVFMSQCGLGLFLFAWALLGAAAFHFTEGPFELSEAQRLKALQNDLVVGLATDLRLVDNLQPAWRETIEKYIDKHEVLLLESVSSGYGEGGGKNGQIWSYPGCILFAISLLTTLGFGAPVPRTTMGRTTAVVFSAIGIPLHFLLILNIGMVLARRLQRWSTAYPSYTLDNLNEKKCHSFDINIALPKWLNWFPVGTGIAYYILGTLIFGVARSRKFESFLFPLDFTATGGVGLTPGYMRIGYGLYLEGAVILGGIAISLLQNSATSKLTDIGLKLGLLTNS